MRISDWSSDVCSSDLLDRGAIVIGHQLLALDAPAHALAFQRVGELAEIDIDQIGRPAVDRHLIPAPLLARAVNFGNVIAGRERLAVADLDGRKPLREEIRSEEHTSELQSLMRISYAVFCLKYQYNILLNTTTSTLRFVTSINLTEARII